MSGQLEITCPHCNSASPDGAAFCSKCGQPLVDSDMTMTPDSGAQPGRAHPAAKSVDFTDELPRHPTGKLYKRLLRDRYWGESGSRIV